MACESRSQIFRQTQQKAESILLVNSFESQALQMDEHFCEVWRKRCKQVVCQAVRRYSFSGSLNSALCLDQSLLDISDDIGSVLDAHREADEVGGDAGGLQLRIGHLAVGGAGGV